MAVLRRAAVGAALLMGCGAGAAQSAVAAPPPFRLGKIECLNGGLLRAYPPTSMRSVYRVTHYDSELVKWSPDLQVYTRQGWRNYDTTAPFFSAFATYANGFSNTLNGPGWSGRIGQLRFVPFTGLRPGTYRVRHHLYWSALRRTYRYVNSQTCRFTATAPATQQQAPVSPPVSASPYPAPEQNYAPPRTADSCGDQGNGSWDRMYLVHDANRGGYYYWQAYGKGCLVDGVPQRLYYYFYYDAQAGGWKYWFRDYRCDLCGP